jgi:hypothetical protein
MDDLVPDAQPDGLDKIRVAAIYGSDFPEHADAFRNKTRQITGIADFPRIIQDSGIRLDAMFVTPSYFRRGFRWQPENYQLICNAITDPDQHPKTLAIAQKLEKASAARCLNPPRHLALVTRDNVARLAAAIPGINSPKTLRLQHLTPTGVQNLVKKEDFRWPGILRPLGSHNGLLMRLCANVDEALAEMNGKIDHYLSEFVDYRSADGVYRKWRLYVIGDRILARSLVIGEHWNLHARSRASVPAHIDLAQEERAFYATFDEERAPGLAGLVRALADKLKLDYFGLDCSFTSPESFVLFEANPTMNFGARKSDPKRPHKDTRLPLAVKAARALVAKACGQGLRQNALAG